MINLYWCHWRSFFLGFGMLLSLSACLDEDDDKKGATLNFGQGYVNVSTQDIQGLWSGSALPGGQLTMLVQPNGAFYQFWGVSAPSGTFFGVFNVSNGALSLSSNSGVVPGLSSSNPSVPAATVGSNSFSLTLGSAVDNSSVLSANTPSVVLSLSSTPNGMTIFNSPLSLGTASLAGTYSGTSLGQANTYFSVDASGNLNGTLQGPNNEICSLQKGSMVVPDATHGFAAIKITTNCSDGLSGAGVALLLPNGSSLQLDSGTQNGTGASAYALKL